MKELYSEGLANHTGPEHLRKRHARKPANKGDGQPQPAEWVEGRGLAQGNRLQQTRYRAPDREVGTDMTSAKRALSGKPRKQPSAVVYVSPQERDLQQALERILGTNPEECLSV